MQMITPASFWLKVAHKQVGVIAPLQIPRWPAAPTHSMFSESLGTLMLSLKAQHPQPWRAEKVLGKGKILLRLISLRRQASNPDSYPWDIVKGGCLWGLWATPAKWQRKGIRGHGNELCTPPERGVKRGNFWYDGCRRWCPICFSSLEFTASAALCKQLGSKTRRSAISSAPSPFFVFFSSFPSFFFSFQGYVLERT